MAVRSTQQVLIIAYNVTTATIDARLTTMKAEVLMKTAAAPPSAGGGTIVSVIMSG